VVPRLAEPDVEPHDRPAAEQSAYDLAERPVAVQDGAYSGAPRQVAHAEEALDPGSDGGVEPADTMDPGPRKSSRGVWLLPIVAVAVVVGVVVVLGDTDDADRGNAGARANVSRAGGYHGSKAAEAHDPGARPTGSAAVDGTSDRGATEHDAESTAPPSLFERTLKSTGDDPAADDTAADDDTSEDGDAEAEDVDRLVARAKHLYRRGSRTQTQATVDRILAVDPQNARALALKSVLLIERGELDAALTAAYASIAAEPDFADGYLAAGVIQQEQGEFARAVDAYERYLELKHRGRYVGAVRRELTRLQGELAHQDTQ
jgi:hypothetical protein